MTYPASTDTLPVIDPSDTSNDPAKGYPAVLAILKANIEAISNDLIAGRGVSASIALRLAGIDSAVSGKADATHAAQHKTGGADPIRLDELAPPTADVDVNARKITGLAAPTSANDAARKQYVDDAIAALVASSPAALDTLNELAAALGNDPSFATTIATSIGTKVSKAGDTMTGQLGLVGDPVAPGDAARKAYVDAGDALAVPRSLYDAHSILAATADDTPAALPVGASTVVGRAATGGIVALTQAQLTALVNLATTTLPGAVPATGTPTGRFLKDDMTWAVAGGSSSGVQLQGGTAPTAGVGSDGDWYSRDQPGSGNTRVSPPILYGPKAAGAWPTEFKRVLPNAARYMGDQKAIVSTGIGPVSLALTMMENLSVAPVVNPFTAVTSFWTATAGSFHCSNRANNALAVMSNSPVPAYETAPPLTQLGVVRVDALPSATDGAIASVGVGSVHSQVAPYGYAVWTDRDGRFCLGKYNTGPDAGSPGTFIVSTGTGVVTAGRYLVFLRIGALFQGYVLTAAGALVAGSQLVGLIDGSFDGAFATGPGVFCCRSQDARLSNFYALG